MQSKLFFRSAAARTSALLSSAQASLRHVEHHAPLPPHSLPLVGLLLLILLGAGQLFLLTSRAASQQEERFQLLVSQKEALQAVLQSMKAAEEEDAKTLRDMEAEVQRLRQQLGPSFQEGGLSAADSQAALDRLRGLQQRLEALNAGSAAPVSPKEAQKASAAVAAAAAQLKEGAAGAQQGFGEASKCFADLASGLRSGSKGAVPPEQGALLVALAANLSSTVFWLEGEGSGAQERQLERAHAGLAAAMEAAAEEKAARGEKRVRKGTVAALAAQLKHAEEECRAAADSDGEEAAALRRLGEEARRARKAVWARRSECPAVDCSADKKRVALFLNYTQRDFCPRDLPLASALLLGGACACLPRRLCHAANRSAEYPDPPPLPGALWDNAALSDAAVEWGNRECSSFHCLRKQKQPPECPTCFDLAQEEEGWIGRDTGEGKKGGWTESLADVLRLKRGGIRIGLDVGGGTGSFAAAMMGHQVTMFTIPPTRLSPSSPASAKSDPPYAEAIALRGLLPLQVPLTARLPFPGNALDLVHVDMQARLGERPFDEAEAMMFEWDRVLRPGGLLWLDLEIKQATKLPAFFSLFSSFAYISHVRNVNTNVNATVFSVRATFVAEKPRQREPTPMPSFIRSMAGAS